MFKKLKFTVTIVLIAVAGCTTPQSAIFKNNGPTIKETFRNITSGGSASDSLSNETYSAKVSADNASYTRTKENEINQLFPELENPFIQIYIFPHLKNGYPIPGYTTGTYLYNEAANFALPGEVVR